MYMKKYVVSYSGGLGSFMAAYLLHQAGKDYDLIFCDTNAEDFDLYRFLNETKSFFGKEIISLNNGLNIWQAQHIAFYQANSQVDPCSRILKREQFKKYMKKNYKPEDSCLVLGIDGSEKHRTQGFEDNHRPYRVYCPLIESATTREDILDILDKIGINPPRLYEADFKHNNCGGFCVKSGQKQAAQLLKHFPENYKWHEEKQEALFTLMEQKKPTIRKTTNGILEYLSLKDFREMVQAGIQPELFEEGNCACF